MRAFSSVRRALLRAMSKMPPQLFELLEEGV
jgi:hypothetical protein